MSSPSFYGWKLVAVFFFIYFLNASFPYYGGTVINAFMAEELGLDRSALGLGFSTYVIAVGLSGPLIGMLVNKVGIRVSLTIGGLLITTGALLMSFVTATTWHYVLFFGVIIGVGGSIGSIYPVQTGITLWFRRRKSLAMAIVLCSSGFGALVAAPTVNRIIQSPNASWNEAWWLIAATGLIATVLTLVGVRDKPEDLGQHPDGIDPASIDESEQLTSKSLVFQTTDPWTMSQAIRTPVFWLLSGATLGFLAPFNLAISHGLVHLRDSGLGDELASLSVGIVVMSSIAGRLLAGFLGDKIEPRFIWAVGLMLLGAGVYCLSIAASAMTVYAYAILLGLGFGAAYLSMATLIGNYFGAAAFAPTLGVLGMGANLLGALSPILGGRVFDQLGSYAPAFSAVIAVAIVASVMALVAVPPKFKAA